MCGAVKCGNDRLLLLRCCAQETLALNVADFQLSLRSPGTFAPHTLPKKALMKPDSPPHGISYRRSEYYSASPPKAAAPAATAQTQAPQASTSDVMIDVDATAPVVHSETAVKVWRFNIVVWHHRICCCCCCCCCTISSVSAPCRHVRILNRLRMHGRRRPRKHGLSSC